METTSAILVELLGKFRADDFYTISFRSGSIRLQGFFSEHIMNDLKEFDYTLSITSHGFQVFNFKFKGIEIDVTITQKKS